MHDEDEDRDGEDDQAPDEPVDDEPEAKGENLPGWFPGAGGQL